MNKALWLRINQVAHNRDNSNTRNRSGVNENPQANPKCSWCKGVMLHKALNLWPYKSVCPIKELPAAKA